MIRGVDLDYESSVFHFRDQGGRWLFATGKKLGELLARVIEKQSGERIESEF